MSHQPVIIGWREYIDLPDWGVRRIKAKADTGARTSAIDVANIEELPNDRVRFDVVIDRDHPDRRETIVAKVQRRARVKSSLGRVVDRIIVETTLRLGEVSVRTEVGLVCRKNMLCRMLIGRRTLEQGFLVDSHHKYRFGGRKRRRKQRKE